jgi:hypothetical protein
MEVLWISLVMLRLSSQSGYLVRLSGCAVFLVIVLQLTLDWHCPTSRKVAVSIPDGVTGIFH